METEKGDQQEYLCGLVEELSSQARLLWERLEAELYRAAERERTIEAQRRENESLRKENDSFKKRLDDAFEQLRRDESFITQAANSLQEKDTEFDARLKAEVDARLQADRERMAALHAEEIERIRAQVRAEAAVRFAIANNAALLQREMAAVQQQHHHHQQHQQLSP